MFKQIDPTDQGVGGRRPCGSDAPLRRLAVPEVLELDGDRLVEWIVAEGEIEAQRQIDDAFRALATQTAALVQDTDPDSRCTDDDLLRSCAQIATGARFAGVPRVAQVAEDVARCVARGDRIAMTAVLHRLVRLSALALRQSWDIAGR